MHVSLGVHGSYVLLGKSGDLLWDLKGHYTDLDEILMGAKSGVKHVALSIFASNYYYVEFSDGRKCWSVPESWDIKG